MKNTLSFIFLVVLSFHLSAQTGTLRGKVFDAANKEAIPFANVVVQGTQIGTSTDFDGNFEITGVPLGYVRIVASVVGYKQGVSTDVQVTQNRIPFVDLGLESTTTDLKEFVVETSAFRKSEESPVSLQTIGVEEIERNPGGNRDISRVIQSLPGVGSTSSFRNDIIIRGGAPNENRFYLDDVETPVINHFQTQGSSGGPVGMLNVNLVREVNLYTGAFPSNRGNTLSSVLEFKQVDGNKERQNLRGTVGSSDLAISLDGPIGEKTTYIVSARRSYLQFLFAAIGLPFLPTFNDMQFKVKHRFDDKNEIYFVGLGAIDQFRLNKSVNDRIDDPDRIERNNYILGNIPINEQWNYTIGAVYKHYGNKSFQTWVVSRNMLSNRAFKYEDNDESRPKILDYNSSEAENKFRFENTTRTGKYKINLGVNLEDATYFNSTFNRIGTPQGPITRDFSSDLMFYKYGGFGQISRQFIENRLIVSFGFRFDGNNYNSTMANPLNQFSPRLSASYSLTEKLSLNFNTGRYYQLPAYTVLGYRNAAGDLENKDRVQFIQADHLVGGFAYNLNNNTKISIEGFYKQYNYYPFSLTDSISLANLGADFGVIGNEPIASINEGRAYGAEFLVQRRSSKGLYGILAYTWVRSEFEDRNGDYIPSAWDSRHIVTFTGGKKFKKNWELGARWRFVGGLPFTPYNEQASAQIENWNVNGRGIFDYNRLNTERQPAFHQLDLRVDKVWFFKKWSLNLYLDIQNVYNFQAIEQDILNVRRDINGEPIIDNTNPNSYELYRIANTAGQVLPTIGVIVDF